MLPLSDCIYPWLQCYIRPETGINISPCCHIVYPNKVDYMPKALMPGETIAESWNSSEMQRLRREIASGETSLRPCNRNCRTRQNGFPNFSVYLDRSQHDLGDKQRDNLVLALSEYGERAQIVKSTPVVIVMRFGWGCNLDCIMCCHEEMARRFPEQMSTDWLIAQKEALRKACYISLDGGEALAIPEGVKFLNWLLDDPEMIDSNIVIHTNGLCLDRFNDRFAGRKITLHLSLDSYGKHYERIRRKSSWEKVSSNIDVFLRNSGTNSKGRRVHVFCTIMRSSLPGLLDLVKWCAERRLLMNFDLADLRPPLDLSRESFRANPALLLETPEWRSVVSACVERLDAYGDLYTLDGMRRIEKELSELEEQAFLSRDGAPKAKGMPRD